jgi:hypothetical protein
MRSGSGKVAVCCRALFLYGISELVFTACQKYFLVPGVGYENILIDVAKGHLKPK